MKAHRVRHMVAAVLIAAGAAVCLTAAYEIVDPFASSREHALAHKLQHQWATAPPPPGARASPPAVRTSLGQPFAFIQIPAFGAQWKFAVVEGTSLAQLATGPGHVTGTQFPGQPGNFAVAAHDITAGNPFLHLKSLRDGDLINVTTQYATYKYAVTGKPRTVPYTDIKVLAPIPGHHDITLITCTPVTLAFTYWRVIVTGSLVGEAGT